MLWGLKQVFGSIMTGLRSKFDFEWTTTQTTVISHRRRELFLPLPVFFFWVSSVIALHNMCFVVFLHFPLKFRAGLLGLLSINFNFQSVIFSQWYFPSFGQSTNENLWEIVASSPFLRRRSLVVITLGWLASRAQMEILLACYLFCFTSTFSLLADPCNCHQNNSNLQIVSHNQYQKLGKYSTDSKSVALF